jgi:hypothetical protein
VANMANTVATTEDCLFKILLTACIVQLGIAVAVSSTCSLFWNPGIRRLPSRGISVLKIQSIPNVSLQET